MDKPIYGIPVGVGGGKGKADAEPTATDGRKSLAHWYQPFFYPIWRCWTDEAYDEEGIEFIRPSDRAYESLPFPTGTQNITDFTGFTEVYMEEYNIDYAHPIVVKKFTGTLDVSGATSLGNLFEGIEELEEIEGISGTSHIEWFRSLYSFCSSLTTVPPIDTSNGKNLGFMYYSCKSLKRIPKIDASKADDIYQILGSCTSLTTVDEFIVHKNLKANNSFHNCSALETFIVSGVIGQNGYNFKWSNKLNKESINSIVNALSEDTSALSVTLSLTAVKNAFETSQGAADGNTSAEWLALIATKPNWTINFA